MSFTFQIEKSPLQLPDVDVVLSIIYILNALNTQLEKGIEL